MTGIAGKARVAPVRERPVQAASGSSSVDDNSFALPPAAVVSMQRCRSSTSRSPDDTSGMIAPSRSANAARIEAGTPLYNLDFGPTSLPHESAIVDQRVRFDKGCYLGQEVVARMQSLGHPTQRLVSLEIGRDQLNHLAHARRQAHRICHGEMGAF